MVPRHQSRSSGTGHRRPDADSASGRTPEFAGPGYTSALRGNMVVHRAAERTAEGERITMANSYVASDMSTNDQSRSAHLISVDDPELFWAEWARFAAWRSAGRLQVVLSDLPCGST
ncbi:MAG: hypothetical protein ACKVIQ_21410, partial [Acidimicrobiales bacterium]